MFDRRTLIKALGATAVSFVPVAVGPSTSAWDHGDPGLYAVPDGRLSIELFDGETLVASVPLHNVRVEASPSEVRFFADDVIWRHVTMAATHHVIVIDAGLGFPLRIPGPRQEVRHEALDGDFTVSFGPGGAAVISTA